MWYIGLDFHFLVSVICVLNQHGKVVFRKSVKGTMYNLIEELEKVKHPFKICFEASTGYGTLYEELSRIAKEVIVAHPGKTRLIFNVKKKSDRIDAKKLATLLFLEEVPAVYVPDIDVRSWRTLINHRNGLVNQRKGAKNKTRSFLRHLGILAPKGLWNRKGMHWLKTLAFKLSADTVQRDSHVMNLEMINEMIQRVEKELNAIAKKHPGVKLLRSIPGIGIRTAEAVMAYIDNAKRFPRTRSIGDYFGMVPCLDQSANTWRLGHITKDGPSVVRRVITEAAWQAVRRCKPIRERFHRYMREDKERKKKAIVAVGHYLLRVMCAMLKRDEEWNPALA